MVWYCVVRGDLGGEDDAGPAEVDLDGPEVGARHRVPVQQGDLGQVLQQVPLPGPSGGIWATH